MAIASIGHFILHRPVAHTPTGQHLQAMYALLHEQSGALELGVGQLSTSCIYSVKAAVGRPHPNRVNAFLPAMSHSASGVNSVFKSSTSRRLVVQALLGFRLESPTRLSGQVGRLAGDLSFSVD
jgi:hypothetical protein